MATMTMFLYRNLDAAEKSKIERLAERIVGCVEACGRTYNRVFFAHFDGPKMINFIGCFSILADRFMQMSDDEVIEEATQQMISGEL